METSTKPTLIILVGLPRSGKSTWAKASGHPIVCPDAIRLALHGQTFCDYAEPMVWTIARYMVKSLFGAGHETVVLDACNTTKKRRQEWESPDEWQTRLEVFCASKDTCIERARATMRPDIIPVIERMAEKIEWPLDRPSCSKGADCTDLSCNMLHPPSIFGARRRALDAAGRGEARPDRLG